MTKEQKEDILGYIKKSIPDIARKYGVTQDEVILVMSEVIPCELKQCETSTHKEDYVLIPWPEIQEYMYDYGFDQEACLADSDEFVRMYGSSAYFVNKLWLDSVLKKRHEEEEADAYLSSMEAHEQI